MPLIESNGNNGEIIILYWWSGSATGSVLYTCVYMYLGEGGGGCLGYRPV